MLCSEWFRFFLKFLIAPVFSKSFGDRSKSTNYNWYYTHSLLILWQGLIFVCTLVIYFRYIFCRYLSIFWSYILFIFVYILVIYSIYICLYFGHIFYLYLSIFWLYIFSYIFHLSSSSCHAASMDIPDPLSPRLPIIHRLWQVFRVTSLIIT